MSNAPIITFQRKIDVITLHNDDTLTVYLRGYYKGEPHESDAEYAQIELRVTKAGKVEVFTEGVIRLKKFTDWSPDD
jgi:hypothetical protein